MTNDPDQEPILQQCVLDNLCVSGDKRLDARPIERFGVRAVIGKGGMGPKTSHACKDFGCVYLHAIGGAAQIYARCVEGVDDVHLKQFGSPEAVWVMRVKDFPAVVTMDSHGRSLHAEVGETSKQNLQSVLT